MVANFSEIEAEIEDRWAEVYDQIYVQRLPHKGLLHDFQQYVYDQLLTRCDTPRSPEMLDVRLLDAGCGTGALLELFHQNSKWKLAGIDLSTKMVNIAKQKCPDADFTIGTFESLPQNTEKFDVIIGSEWLHHVPDLKPIFDQAYVLLKPGGLFCVVEPSKDWLFEQVGIRQAMLTLIVGPLLKCLSFLRNREIQTIKDIEGDRGYNPWHRHLSVSEVSAAIDRNKFEVHLSVKNTIAPYFSGVLFGGWFDNAVYRTLKMLDRLFADRMNRGAYIFITAIRKKRGELSQ